MTTLILIVGCIMITVGLAAATIDVLKDRLGGRQKGRTTRMGGAGPLTGPDRPLPPAIFDRDLHGL